MTEAKAKAFDGAWGLGRRGFLLGVVGAAAAAFARALGVTFSGNDAPSTDRSAPAETPRTATLSDHEAAFYRPLLGRGNDLAG